MHWAEDAYVREDTPLLGSFLKQGANVIHHHLPRFMTRHNWWQSSWDLLALSTLIVFGAGRLDVLTWQVWLFAVVSTNANQVHKWSRIAPAPKTGPSSPSSKTFACSKRRNTTPSHQSKNVRYCPITVVNPILGWPLPFFGRLEWLLALGAPAAGHLAAGAVARPQNGCRNCGRRN